jgi:hypothetical protein
MGWESSRAEVHRLPQEALDALAIFIAVGVSLGALGNYLLEREH